MWALRDEWKFMREKKKKDIQGQKAFQAEETI